MSELKGYFVYKNHVAMQHEGALQAFKDFLSVNKPQRIVEIGTADGGLTLALRNILDELGMSTVPIRSFDVQPRPWYDSLISQNIEIFIENLFDDSYDRLIKPDLILPFIQAPGLTLVLCDGGYKVGEFNVLAPQIKPGDFIMVHDYIDTVENFQNHYYGKIWNWQEVKDSDLDSVSQEYGLVDVNQDLFKPVVWACKVKKVVNE
jgi:cephalosporin hydroxylase